MNFPTEWSAIVDRVQSIRPEEYGASRNYVDGELSYLSPYISRGVLSTKMVFKHVSELGLPWYKVEKFVQELAWRDYWQQVWKAKGEAIFTDLRQPQSQVVATDVPNCLMNASTGIRVVDKAIKDLYAVGYMHNHMRMYVASIAVNIANVHWLNPAEWMYAHLLDGDLASNHLSWQWIAGTFSNKKYYANQENINRYFKDNQEATFLDVSYDEFPLPTVPDVLSECAPFCLEANLPKSSLSNFDKQKTTLIYNYYNLDPNWRRGEELQRVLLLEPSLFEKYPVSPKCIDFVMKLARNIEGLQVFVGEFDDLAIDAKKVVFKEHPLNKHYEGRAEERDWLSSVEGDFRSFFAFWKKCKKELRW